ncbi:MAG: esterase-like activity of phytase family protein [Planctomycetota bacterium]
MKTPSISTVLCSVIAAASAWGQDLDIELFAERSLQPAGEFWGTVVGGISGVDYEPISKRWVMVSDGRGPNGPTRAYEFAVVLENDRLRKFQLLGKLPMNHGDGTGLDADLYDPEAVRLRPARFFDGDDDGDPTLIWADEGVDGRPPAIYEACMGATWMDQWPAPDELVPTETAGVRNNLGFESMAMLPSGDIIVATEDALKQDGPRTTTLAGAQNVRLYHYDLSSPGTPPTRGWVYPLDPPPARLGPLAIAGLVELVALDDDTLLALERAYSPTGGTSSRVYRIELASDGDPLGVPSLSESDVTPVEKTLLVDLADVRGVRPANYEGLALGPELDDGRRLLVVVSDNNFDRMIPTRVVFLAASGLD